jgi:hypothetical protein
VLANEIVGRRIENPLNLGLEKEDALTVWQNAAGDGSGIAVGQYPPVAEHLEKTCRLRGNRVLGSSF